MTIILITDRGEIINFANVLRLYSNGSGVIANVSRSEDINIWDEDKTECNPSFWLEAFADLLSECDPELVNVFDRDSILPRALLKMENKRKLD